MAPCWWGRALRPLRSSRGSAPWRRGRYAFHEHSRASRSLLWNWPRPGNRWGSPWRTEHPLVFPPPPPQFWRKNSSEEINSSSKNGDLLSSKAFKRKAFAFVFGSSRCTLSLISVWGLLPTHLSSVLGGEVRQDRMRQHHFCIFSTWPSAWSLMDAQCWFNERMRECVRL